MSVGTFSLAVQPNTLPNSTVGASYNQTLTAVGGNPPYTFTVSSGTLPTGLTLNSSTGQISGTTTTNGSFTFIIRADDPDGNNGYRTYVVKVGANILTINPATLPNGTQGFAYSQTVSASGGTAPYSYYIDTGALPAGLSLNTSNGQITGTPSAGGTYTFAIRAFDADANYGSRNYTVTIGANSLTLTPSTLPNTTVGSSYSQTVTASGGTGGPYTYSIASGSLPTGLSLNTSSGAITGTASTAGTYNFTINAVDGSNNYGNQAYTVNVGSNSLTVNPASLPNGTQAVAYSQTVTATGGTAPYTYAVTSGALPTGLSLNTSTGAITGTPSTAGGYTFTIGATDAVANFGSRNYNVTIAPPPLNIAPSTLPNGTQGTAYSQTLTTANGTGPYTYAITSGALPTGLSLNTSTGQISGTPSASGTYNFTAQSTDSTSNTGTRAYTVAIGTNSLTVNPATLPNGTVGTAYSQTITASGGAVPYTYAVSAGTLPAGLSLNPSTGAITGTPTASGPASFTIQATDNGGNTGSRAYSFNIGGTGLTVNPATLPNGTQGTAYSQTVTTTGGTAPYTYAIISGALPTGLTLNTSSGAITGTPSAPGSYAFTVQSTDNVSSTGTRAYTVAIGSNSLTVNPATLPNGTTGTAYSQTVAATGGTAPYTYAVSVGTLPAGLSLNTATGAITGTPTASGPANFTIQATDNVGNIGSRAYAFNIGGSTLTVNPATLPNGTTGTAYSQTITASGGTAPYTYAVSVGTRCRQVCRCRQCRNRCDHRHADRERACKLHHPGDRQCRQHRHARTYTLTIGSASLTLNPASLPAAPVGRAYSQTITVSGGTAPYTFALASGALPPGLSLNTATGAITGTPTTIGSFAFGISATDSGGNTGARSFTISTSRIDPSTDPDVRALQDAQAASARRFADAQTTNVMRRLESLHDGFNPCGVSFGVTASTPIAPAAPYELPYGGEKSTPISKDPWGAPASSARAAEPVRPSCDPSANYAIWSAGSIELGKMTSSGTVSNKFSTSGVSVGVDARVFDKLIIGAAAGFGSDRTDIGLRGSISDSTSKNAMVYASYAALPSTFIDAVVGKNWLDFDNRRADSLSGSSVSGKRTGDGWFGSIGISHNLNYGSFRISPYARFDTMTATLAKYSEEGDPAAALTYGASKVTSNSAVVGLRGSIDIQDDTTVFTPIGRIEYRRIFDGALAQEMYFSDLGAGTSYRLDQGAASRNLVTGAIGLRARFGVSGMVEVEYGRSGSPERFASWQSQIIRATARWGF